MRNTSEGSEITHTYYHRACMHAKYVYTFTTYTETREFDETSPVGELYSRTDSARKGHFTDIQLQAASDTIYISVRWR